MLNNKYHHYESLSSFLSKRFSASPDDTSYTYGGLGEVFQGEPDISWKSIVFVKESGWICTHGKIYDASGMSDGLKRSVKVNGTDFDGTEDLTTEEWGKPRNITITDGENQGSPVTVNGGEDITLSLPETINSKVVYDTFGRAITETYLTDDALQDALDDLETFFVYSGEDDSRPTLDTLPASEWTDFDSHAGDWFVTTEGRIYRFEETGDNLWEWVEKTDHYLYGCLEELEELEKKVTGSIKRWEGLQEFIEKGDIKVDGQTMKSVPYLDVLSCPGFVNYRIAESSPIYLPFRYGGKWTKTLTSYFRVPRLVKTTDLSRISGKTIVFTNEVSSLGTIEVNLGKTPLGDYQRVVVSPGKVCILKLLSDIKDGKLVFWWESSELGETEDWV